MRVDLDSIDSYKIGCNAVYRDLRIDCMVAVDRRMVEEAVDNSFRKPVYTRRDWASAFDSYGNVIALPDLPYQGTLKQDDPWHWGSGPHACNLAAQMMPTEIHLWGFDLWSNDGQINNVYKGTKNYDAVTHHAIDPRFWIYQLSRCFENYRNIMWIQHQTQGWKIPNSWNHSNLIIKS